MWTTCIFILHVLYSPVFSFYMFYTILYFHSTCSIQSCNFHSTCSIQSCIFSLHVLYSPVFSFYMFYTVLYFHSTCSIQSCIFILHVLYSPVFSVYMFYTVSLLCMSDYSLSLLSESNLLNLEELNELWKASLITKYRIWCSLLVIIQF